MLSSYPIPHILTLHPQERPVIIMSTTRSNQNMISHDLRHTLGFVGNPRRFNGERMPIRPLHR
jgi:hypothetical protein